MIRSANVGLSGTEPTQGSYQVQVDVLVDGPAAIIHPPEGMYQGHRRIAGKEKEIEKGRWREKVSEGCQRKVSLGTEAGSSRKGWKMNRRHPLRQRRS